MRQPGLYPDPLPVSMILITTYSSCALIFFKKKNHYLYLYRINKRIKYINTYEVIIIVPTIKLSVQYMFPIVVISE